MRKRKNKQVPLSSTIPEYVPMLRSIYSPTTWKLNEEPIPDRFLTQADIDKIMSPLVYRKLPFSPTTDEPTK